MKAPIEMMLDGVTWVATDSDTPADRHDFTGIPYTTHEGVLEIMGHRLRCCRLSNGQAVFHQDDVLAFFNAELPQVESGK